MAINRQEEDLAEFQAVMTKLQFERFPAWKYDYRDFDRMDGQELSPSMIAPDAGWDGKACR